MNDLNVFIAFHQIFTLNLNVYIYIKYNKIQNNDSVQLENI